VDPAAFTSQAAQLGAKAGPPVALILLGILIVTAVAILCYRLRVDRFREQALDSRSGLKRWARARGWQADDLSNLALYERAERAMALAGDLGVELRLGAGARFDTDATELGTIVAGLADEGQVVVFETWKGDGRAGRWVIIAVEIARELPRRTVDLLGSKPSIKDGGDPHALIQAIAGLPSPCRARQGGTQVVVVSPGRLDAGVLEWLLPRALRLAKEAA
jgi:hypothetical protein